MSVGGVGGGSSYDPADYTDLGPEPPPPADPAATLDHVAAHMPTVRPGSTGPAVRDLQTKLNASRSRLGLPQLPVTGTFGPQTERAVVTFQKLWGLAPDAVVGPATWRRLFGEPNPAMRTPPRGSVEERIAVTHRDAILAAARHHGVPPVILAAIVDQESKGRADAVSHVGDHGLMQINRRAHPSFFASNNWQDPYANSRYGTGVFETNLRAFEGESESVEKAVAAYNAGVAGVRRGLAAGLPLERITYSREYVPNIMQFTRKYADYF